MMRITIMSSSPEDGEPGTIVEVTDTGPGVDPLVEKKLFQPFVTTKGEKRYRPRLVGKPGHHPEARWKHAHQQCPGGGCTAFPVRAERQRR